VCVCVCVCVCVIFIFSTTGALCFLEAVNRQPHHKCKGLHASIMLHFCLEKILKSISLNYFFSWWYLMSYDIHAFKYQILSYRRGLMTPKESSEVRGLMKATGSSEVCRMNSAFAFGTSCNVSRHQCRAHETFSELRLVHLKSRDCRICDVTADPDIFESIVFQVEKKINATLYTFHVLFPIRYNKYNILKYVCSIIFFFST
jgi:hypothetical protein